MKFQKTRKWMKRVVTFLAVIGVALAGLLGYILDKNERTISAVNALIIRGDLVSAEDLLVREENFFLTKAKNRFARLRDGRMKVARCRTEFGLGLYETAIESCHDAASYVRTSDEKFSAYYYMALSKLNRGLSVGAGVGAATDAIYYLKEALKVKEDGEAQGLLASLLEEEVAFKEAMKGQKEKDRAGEKSRVPSLFRDEGGDLGGTKGKGY